ncbi:MAG: helicase [Bacteroidales bacterium 36-12]|nr:MAG: helicase [Bacteroidales bacterium 36-12]
MAELITTPKFKLTSTQEQVFKRFKLFIQSNERSIFILKGYAGTGKTTLIRHFIKELKEQDKSYCLMASTGRAAKILTNITKAQASTIHSVIYNFKDFNQDLEEIVRQEDKTGIDKTGQLFLTFELSPITSASQIFYIIDESSMISDEVDPETTQALFGSGKLLSDLMAYDPNGKFIFVGDECQLPPVSQDISPALHAWYFKEHFNLEAIETALTEIVRQAEGNTIIAASQRIREMYANPPKVRWGKLPLKNYADIYVHSDLQKMINAYLSQIRNKNYNKATFIASSNNKCNQLNHQIRKSLSMSDTLQVGDLLLVTQNNIISGFMNGDMVVVEQIKNIRYQKAGLSFLMVEIRDLATDRRFDQLLIEDILYGSTPNLSQQQQQALFIDFYRRMRSKNIKQKDTAFKEKLNTDSYLNALRCVFGYTLTCHKSQGGEWPEVYVDFPRNITLEATPSKYQWVYTAITRAREKLHLVNDFFIE